MLCHRVGIMVNSRLQCIGSTEQLKQTYGTGYEIIVKTTVNEDPNHDSTMPNSLIHIIQQSFRASNVNPAASLSSLSVSSELSGSYRTYKLRLPSSSLSLSALFSGFESSRQSLSIIEYSISQCT